MSKCENVKMSKCEYMKRFSIYIVLCTLSLTTLLSSCGVYRKYKSQTEVPDDLYGSGDSIAQIAMADSATIADISWREFFRDPLLQTLIDSALVRNTDLRAARVAVEQAQASLTAAKLAYLPSLTLNPQASISSTMGTNGSFGAASYTYHIPLQLDWNIGIAGSVTVQKRKAQAILEQAKYTRDATRANLISSVAQYYFQLHCLDCYYHSLTYLINQKILDYHY